MPHRVHTRPARLDREPAVSITTDANVVGAFLEDAAHFPGGHAPAVAYPRSEGEVAALVRDTHPVLPVGAQSSLTGGATPMGETVVATDHLDRVIAVSRSEITVQAGVPLYVLQRELAPHGAFYPPVPTYDGAMAGGVIATNAAGAATFKYGSTREWVRGITVVLADGSVLDLERGQTTAHSDGYFELVHGNRTTRVPVPSYRMPDVAKRSAGYFASPGMDLIDLFIGSEGTLGIVTEARFVVIPRRPNLCLVWILASDERRALDLVATLRREAQTTWRTRDPRGIDLAGVEHLDRRSLEILREDGADRTHEVPLPADATVALLAQIELPDDAVPSNEDAYRQIANALSAGAPDTPLVRLCRLLAQAELLDCTEIALPPNRRRQAQLLAIREAVPEAVNRRIGAAQQVSPTIQKTAADMIVRFEQFEDSLQLFRDTFERRGLDYAIWGHISDGNVHHNVIPRSPADVEQGQAAILDCGRAIIRQGGCPLAEHGVGRNRVKQALLRELYGTTGIEQMRRVKRALDPRWGLFPGVLFPPPAVT